MGAEEPSELALPRCSEIALAAMGGWVLRRSHSRPSGNSRALRQEGRGFPPFTFHHMEHSYVLTFQRRAVASSRSFTLSKMAGSTLLQKGG